MKYEVFLKDGTVLETEPEVEDFAIFEDIIYFGDLKIHKDFFGYAAPIK